MNQSSNPFNFVDKAATIGERVKIWHFAIILADAVIGDDVSIGSRTEIGRGTRVGDGTRISSGVFLPSNSVIGRNCFIAPNVTFTDDRYPRAGNDSYFAQAPVLEDGCSVGAGSVVLPGVRIGAGAMIGAGAVVVRDVNPGTVVVGNPARSLGMLFTCQQCGRLKTARPIRVKLGLARFCDRRCAGDWKSAEYKAGNSPLIGLRHSEEVRARLSEIAKQNIGPKNPGWRGGTGGRYWTRQCLERDGYTCQVCRLKDEEIMQVDHVIPKSTRPDLQYVLDNLQSICPNCHERKTRRERRNGFKPEAEDHLPPGVARVEFHELAVPPTVSSDKRDSHLMPT